MECVGDGVLVDVAGVSLFFEDRSDAETFGRDLMMVAALGGDVLDDDLEQLGA